MEGFLKQGYAYIKQNIVENENPNLNSDPVGLLEKGEIIKYENLEKNEFGTWISYSKDDVKRYILAIDNQNNFFTNLPKIKEGTYYIKPFEEIDNELKIDFFNKKLLIQYVPEDDSYRIIVVESNNSLCSNEEKIIEECEIFSENEIKWKIKTNNFNEFYFEDSITGLQMEYSEYSDKLILSEVNNNTNSQKFILFPNDDEQNKGNYLDNENKKDNKIDKHKDDNGENNINDDGENNKDNEIEKILIIMILVMKVMKN